MRSSALEGSTSFLNRFGASITYDSVHVADNSTGFLSAREILTGSVRMKAGLAGCVV